MRKTSVLVVASSAAIKRRVFELLLGERDIVCLTHDADDSHALMLVESHRPDVLLIETGIERALQLVRSVAAMSSGTKTILLCFRANDVFVARFLAFGGCGYVDLKLNEANLAQAVRAVDAGENWAPRRIVAAALKEALKPLERAVRHDALQQQLSKRECEIVEWMRRGMTNKEIARKLGISDMTVKTHAHNIFSKLEVSGRVRLLGLSNADGPAQLSAKSDVDSFVPPMPGLLERDLKPAA